MVSLWNTIGQVYNYLTDDLAHPLTKDRMLIKSPLTLATILIIYNLFCTKIGPMLMKNRPPYKLNKTVTLYNIFQILLSLYMVYLGVIYIFSGKFNFQCEGPDEIFDEKMREHMVRVHIIYFVTKLIDLLDTVFFVLRKSNRQITFLHLYHHTLMTVVSWMVYKYVPGGQSFIIGAMNSTVHVFMYTYYLLSGLGPQYQKYLWWKNYLTMMQIVQFVVIFIHSFNSLFYTCSYPTGLKVLTIIEASVFIYMFSMFYYRNYVKVQRRNRDNNKKTANNRISESTEHYVNGKKAFKKGI